MSEMWREAWEANVALFFASPTAPLDPPCDVSTLYLLRREIQDCLFGEIVEEDEASQKVPEHRLFASAMVIFAGFDLLAKFARDDEPEIGKRFRVVSDRVLQKQGARGGRPNGSGSQGRVGLPKCPHPFLRPSSQEGRQGDSAHAADDVSVSRHGRANTRRLDTRPRQSLPTVC